jgi:hypothetical protein
MKAVFQFLFILTFCQESSAQIYNNPFLAIPVDPDKSPALDIRVNGSYNIASNSLTNRLFSTYSTTTFIDEDTKQYSVPYLKDNNIYGGYQAYNFYISKKIKPTLNYYFSAGYRKENGGLFTNDTYNLLFFGNKDFAGKTAILDGTKNYIQSYYSLQFGFFKHKLVKKDHNFMYGGGFSLDMGESINQVDVKKGSFYTSPAADTIIFDADLTSMRNTRHYGLFSVGGIGASINAFCAYSFQNKNELRFQVEDLGAIYWFDPVHFNVNQKIVFTGANLNTANDQISFSGYNFFIDSLAKKYQDSTTKKPEVKALPFQIRLMYIQNLNSHLTLTGTLEYIYDLVQRPEISLSAENRFSKSFAVRAGFSLLGYGTYGITAGCSLKINKNLNIIVGSQHFEGLPFIPRSHGQGAYATIQWIN